jgi:mRNA-degrading endonuclease toxin of MazEF toxin-antitoxin module
MAYTGPVHRWDTYWADLNPGVGSEQRGEKRPVIVISNDGYNKVFDVVTVLSLTKLEGKERKVYPFEVVLPKGTITPEWSSIVMPQQIRAISKKRLLEPIGTLYDELLRAEIENRLLEHLDIAFDADDPGLL